MTFNHSKPFNELPLLPPKEDIETKNILKKVTTCARAVEQLKNIANQIPNQSVLINTIPLLETQASSEIENIVTTQDDLFKYASISHDADLNPATKEVYRYCTAMYDGFKSIQKRPISTNTALKICQTIRKSEIDLRTMPGTEIINPTTKETIYTPPVGKALIKKQLANWEKFINLNTDIDPLIRMAVMHYQFEAIHPFTDGNGRTGRILNILFLVQEKLLSLPVLFLSRYILQNKSQYYRLIRQVTENGDWEQWILFMLDAVEETAIWTTTRIELILSLLDHTYEYIKAQSPKMVSWELTNLIFSQPYVRIENVIDAGIAKRQTASTYLHQLKELGILYELKRSRPKIFIHTKLLDVLINDIDEFERYEY
ncbi:MAG: addiction module protein [Candidatus Hydrogenedentota bacterium]|nr:MAG: addiction module protein [Candidatus Hydrogenedentota bacterium]